MENDIAAKTESEKNLRTKIVGKNLHRPKKKNLNAKVFIVTMLAFSVIQFVIYWAFVNINSIFLAFRDVNENWTLANFEYVFENFRRGANSGLGLSLTVSLKNTLLYFVKDVLMLFFQFFISYFFYKKIKGYAVFQVIFYLPSILSGVAIAAMFSAFIEPSGPLSIALGKMGIEIPYLFGDSRYANGTIMFYMIWLGWGGHMLLLCGALARVPVEILESARLDGVGAARELFQIILPLVWPTLSTLLILTLTGMFGNSGPVLLFTQGTHGTTTIGYWIYHRVKFDGVPAYGEVSAAGVLITLIAVPVIMFVKWLIERIPAVEY